MKCLLLFCTMLLSLSSLAQLKKGTITYSMVSGTTKKPNLNEGEVVFSFEPGWSRSETTMGVLGTTVNIYQVNSETSLMLFGIGKKNFAVQSRIEPVPEAETVTLFEETKMICGFLCQKAVVTRDVYTFTVWFTDQVQAEQAGQEMFRGLQMTGFPMEIISESNGIKVHLTAVGISAEVPPNAFNLSVPEGYELITKEEIGQKVIEGSANE
jgi:GLPGLI family protein